MSNVRDIVDQRKSRYFLVTMTAKEAGKELKHANSGYQAIIKDFNQNPSSLKVASQPARLNPSRASAPRIPSRRQISITRKGPMSQLWMSPKSGYPRKLPFGTNKINNWSIHQALLQPTVKEVIEHMPNMLIANLGSFSRGPKLDGI